MFVMTLPSLTCPHCHEVWQPRTTQPKRCPNCKHRLMRPDPIRPPFPLLWATTSPQTVTGTPPPEETDDCPIIRPE